MGFQFYLIQLMLVALLMSGPVRASDKQTSSEVVDMPLVAAPKLGADTKQAQVSEPAPDEAYMDYVRDNVVATVYHEFAHALIDMLDLPVLGQEEDAADVLSTLMIDMRHSETEARRIARHSSQSYANDADAMDERGQRPDLSGQHGPARQRYFNAVCMFYGANPDERMDFAEQMQLPDARAGFCPDEYALAAKSWLPSLETLGQDTGTKIRYRNKASTPLGRAIGQDLAELVQNLNSDFSMPGDLELILKRCGARDRGYEAFYSEYFDGDSSITVCTEYVRDLYRQASGRL